MTHIDYSPRGVCSTRMRIDIEDGVIRSIQIDNGCHGNLQGIMALVTGMRVEDVIAKLEGIRCRSKSTSCPDQLAQALKQYHP